MESNMAFGGKLKAFVQRCVKVFGYRIEKLKDTAKAPIDVLDLLLTKVSAERPDFFFVQIGANNGLTDNPIRHFVTKSLEWRTGRTATARVSAASQKLRAGEATRF
jgi:hypothetical protein